MSEQDELSREQGSGSREQGADQHKTQQKDGKAQQASAESQEREKTPVAVDPPSHKDTAVTPSGYRGTNPSTAGPGQTGVRSQTPENAEGRLNPSAPNDVTISPNSGGTK